MPLSLGETPSQPLPNGLTCKSTLDYYISLAECRTQTVVARSSCHHPHLHGNQSGKKNERTGIVQTIKKDNKKKSNPKRNPLNWLCRNEKKLSLTLSSHKRVVGQKIADRPDVFSFYHYPLLSLSILFFFIIFLCFVGYSFFGRRRGPLSTLGKRQSIHQGRPFSYAHRFSVNLIPARQFHVENDDDERNRKYESREKKIVKKRKK